MKIAPVLIAAGLALPAAHGAWAAGFTLADIARITHLSDPQISPDGSRIALLVTTADVASNKPHQDIELVETASGARRVLTRDREGLASPRWSPDGALLAFLAKAPGSPPGPDKPDEKTAEPGDGAGLPQVYVMPMNGGDAQRVTFAPQGVSAFAFSPDGKEIAFVAPDAPPNAKAVKAHNDVFEVTDNHFLTRAPAASSHLWLIATSGGKAKRLTEGAFSLDVDQSEDGPTPAFSPDGKTIAFTRYPGPWTGPSFHAVIGAVTPAGGALFVLEGGEGSSQFRYAPRGGAVAWRRPRGGDQNNGMAVYVRDGGDTIDATVGLARNIDNYAWLPDGKSLLLAGPDGTHAVLWVQPIHGTATKLNLGEVEAGADASVAGNGAIALIGNTPTHPDELYVIDGPGAAPRRLTNFNAFADKISLGETRTIDWTGPGGFHEDGVLVLPPGFDPHGKYPLVLVIHGGPAAQPR